MDVKNLGIEQSKFNNKVVKEIFDKVEIEIKSKVGPLHIAVSEDNNAFSETQEYSRLLETISRVKNEDLIMDNNSKTTIYEGLGSIAAITNDVVYILF